MIVIFCFYYGNRIVLIYIENIVASFPFLTMFHGTLHNNAASSIGILQAHVLLIPTLILDIWLDILVLDVLL